MSADPPLRALLVEDDLRLGALTRDYLERHGVALAVETDGERGLARALELPFDIVLLDIMLPGISGIEVCRRLREHSDIPVIMLTARGEEADRVLGLETGADDYVPKPFSPRELLARMRAQVRRRRGQVGPSRSALRVGALTLDPARHEASLGGVPLDLTSYELSLLYALVERRGIALSRYRLMELTKGGVEDAFDRSIDVHISRLRQKLGDDPRHPRLIRTVRGVGYQFVGEASP